MEHGFTWFRVVCLIFTLVAALLFWDVLHAGKNIGPIVNSDSVQLQQLVTVLNKLQQCQWNCDVHPLARTIECGCKQ